MKRFIKSLVLLFIALFASVSITRADDEATIYLASLKAQKSPASTGDGQVKLTWLDITGKKMQVPLAYQLNYMALGKMASEDGPGATAQLAGGTMIALDGMETPVEIGGSGSQIYMTSFVYFHAEAEPANGSYLADWTFTDPQITRMTANAIPPAPVDPMGDGSEENPYKTPCFKVLPKTENSATFMDEPQEPQRENFDTDEEYQAAMAAYGAAMMEYAAKMNVLVGVAQDVAQNKYNSLYAVFNKYLIGNPVATSANVEAVEDATANLTVTIEVEGDAASLDAADFDTFSFTDNTNSEWSYNLSEALANKEVVSEQKTRITIPVTYTYKNTGYGVKNSTMTVRMAGENPSSLNISLRVVALDPFRPEAIWFDGTTNKTSGNLTDMLAVNTSSYTNPILKINKPVTIDLTFSGKDFSLDLNGNTAQAFTVSSGNVTFAYSSFGGSATSLTVSGGKAILAGGTFGSLTIGANGTVEQNGATISGAVTNNGTLTTTNGIFNGGLTSNTGATLTLNGGTFNGETAVTVSGGTANINRGDINGTTVGLKVTGGTAIVKKLAAITSDGSYSAQRTGGTLNVECGKFGKPLNGTINFTSGYFKNNSYGVSTEGKTEMLVSAGVEYNEGYRYFLGDSESASANGVGVCRIGTTSYAKLEDALAYANNNPSEALVIFMTNDYVLPAGYYTLPEKATLVVPMSDSQEKEINMTAPRVVFNDQMTATPYTSIVPTEFRRLTFASGVNMEVFGNIELTCSQYASNEAYTSQPCGAYGHLVMEEGSRMTLQNGAEIRAWGFMTGKGETDARRGATVREMFQMGDWKGAMTSVRIVGLVKQDEVSPQLWSIVKGDDSDKKIFPVTQYFIQNVESPVKYHPGALLSTSAAVSEGLLGMSVSMAATDIAVVGVDGVHQAIFLMDNEADADNTWVRKWYDVENDIQVYEINSAAHIGSMELDMGDINLLTYGTVPIRLNSAKFDLPLTCNFKIHLLSGSMDFKQNTSLLPGAEVEVDKESTVSVAKNPADEAHTGALYVYDAAEWDRYAYCNEHNGSSMVKGTAYTKVVRYAPSWNGRPTRRDEQTKPASAAINVHGTFNTASGFVYTSASGANIFSSNEDAGTFIFNDDAVNAGTRDVYNVKSVGTYEKRTFYPAQLKNGNNLYVNTSTAAAGDAYCYINNEWTTMYPDEDNSCFMVKHNVNGDSYFAKPAEYVEIVAAKSEGVFSGNSDHTFSDAAGAGRLFILISDPVCHWWEVENVDNLYHCIHPDNDTYYYWDNDAEEWVEKVFYITWKNWDGPIIQTADKDGILQDEYVVTYGTMAEFLGTNPTREADIDYTYNFTGWSPALAPVTSDVTYTATYEAQPRMYTIIFQNEGGTEIERQFLTHNAVPVCENMPTKVGHILTWTPAISPVIGDQTYVAKWLEEPPTEWDVTFVNNANGELQATEKVAINAHPTYNGSAPVKENADHTPYSSDEYTYTFWGWSAVIDGVAQQFAAGTELPCPTAPTTYTAVYTETQKTYVVRFLDENGDLIPGEEYNLPYGAMPVCSNTPTKENTEEWTYGFAWTPQIQTVMASVDPIEYRATFPATKNKYTVTLTSNLSGVCTFTGAGTFDYGTTINNVAVNYDSEKYTFDGWSDLEDSDEKKKKVSHPTFTLTGDVTITANFTPKALEDKTVTKDETWDIPENTEVKDLVLTSDGSTSGQMLNVSNLTIRGKAYFDLTLNAEAQTWYAFAVPWKVDATTGVSVKGGAQLALDNTYHVLYYDGANRAQYGKAQGSWKFLADKSDKTLEPGTLYLIYLNSAANTLRFTKKDGASFNNISVMVEQYPSQTGDDKDANWNGIANPAVYKAYMNAGVGYGQHYNDVVFEMSSHKFIVGEPIFVQAPAKKSVVADNSSYPAAAPRRNVVAENDNKSYEIRIAPQDAEFSDRLYVRTAEEKADKYVIGQDLAKISVATKAAQMWVNRYDAKLCVNTIEEVENQATFPLGIFAPADGQYTISTVTPVANDEELFVTVNGAPVWNLAQGEYNIDLKAGNTDAYGLLLVRERPIPEVTTGCESIEAADKASVRKVLINGQVFIIREGAVYTIFGQKAK